MRVRIDLRRVWQNTLDVMRLTDAPVIAVVKADAYGLGAVAVAGAIGDLVNGFYVFDADESAEAKLFERTGKRTIALHGDWQNPDDYRSAAIQPVVWSVDRASALRSASPVLAVDTGQQRFAASADDAEKVLHAGDCREVMTHAIRLEQVELFRKITTSWQTGDRFLHAAGSALLNEPAAWMNAVRPGLALYRGAVRVCTQLVEARDSVGPAGYTGFITPRFGVIMAGYRNGLKRGPCLVNGTRRQILEVGMQSAFVELGPGDKTGDEVVFLDGLGITESDVASAWAISQQESLVRLCACGIRTYQGL